jgi:hypothetical protein
MSNEKQNDGVSKPGIIFVIFVIFIWKFLDYKDNSTAAPENTQRSQPAGQAAVSPPMFQVKYETSVGENLFGTLVTWKTYSLQNTGEQSESIKWIAINNRDDCLAVPVRSYDKQSISGMEVLSDDDSADVADFLSLEVGQAVPIKMPENCGEPIRLKVGTDRGEYDIGPLTFY